MKRKMTILFRFFLIAGLLTVFGASLVQAEHLDEPVYSVDLKLNDKELTIEKPESKVYLPIMLKNKIMQAKIYFSIDNILYRMNLDGTNVEIVVEGAIKSEQLVVDSTLQKIYLSHWYWPEQLLSFDLVSGEKIELDGPGDGGQGIAIDPITSKIYMGLYYNGVYQLDLNNPITWVRIVDSSSLSPLLGQEGQLQIDPINHHLYFRTTFNGDCGSCRYIWRVDLDGNNLIKIIPANDGNGLALDIADHKMYFSDIPENSTIMRANLDGTGLEPLFTIPAPYQICRAIALDVEHQKMYLSLYDANRDYKARAIARANMDGTGFEILYQTTGISGDALSGGIGLFLP